jgi:hypothetical protein
MNSESLGEYILNPENGLTAINNSKGGQLIVQHIPVDWIIAREIRNGVIKDAEIEERKKALEMFEHYEVLAISMKDQPIEINQITVDQRGKDITPSIIQEEALGTNKKSKYILTIDKSVIDRDLDRGMSVVVDDQEYDLTITSENIKKYHQKITNNEITVE